ncbi:MAG: OmpA family protein [Deltaproteobacteria bacterium]|nr:OmpA family protein [Deltaproteobacteria bacterium]
MKPAKMHVVAAATSITLSAFVLMSSTTSSAAPRDEVLSILEEVVSPAGGPNGQLKVWANEGDDLPLEEGTPISFHFQAREDVHLTAMYLDADGNLVLLYPAPEGTALRKDEQLDLEAGEATTPYGQESLFVVATKQPISRESLGIDSTDAYAVLEHDAAMKAANRLREIVAQGGAIGGVPAARVDLHIVPTSSTGQGYTRGGIVQYFTEATRSLHRPKLNLDINFESGSADLMDEVRGDLDVVGQALSDERLAGKHFRLVGHTDSQGDEDYNQSLSESRARAARQYLMENYQIDPARLDSMGLGESKPMMDGSDAGAMRRNRRVELELIR